MNLSLRVFSCLLAANSAVAIAFAANTGPTPISPERVRAEVYKQFGGGTNLLVHIFEPSDKPVTNRPAIIFFFGGGWSGGTPSQFEPQCKHFVSRGMVAMTADYRVKTRHGVKPTACVADAKSCVRWVRANAARLGIDPHRIVASGGSAGGHLAAATATLQAFDEPSEDKSISSVPNALVLFNPALVLAPMPGLDLAGFDEKVGPERLGTQPAELSPAHHIRHGMPPTIIFHGKADKTVPYSTAEAFTAAMHKAGNRCELVGYEGQGHGFFNLGRGQGYRETLLAADRFLVSLNFLPAQPAGEQAAGPE